jgi:hypothetical protein
MPVIVGWFAAYMWKNISKWYTYLPKLLCNYFSIYAVHKCGCRQHNTTWWVVGWSPMCQIICCEVPASELLISCNFVYVCSFRNCGCFCFSPELRTCISWYHFCNFRMFQIEVICMCFADQDGFACVCHNVKLGSFHRLTYFLSSFFYWIMLQTPPNFGIHSPFVYSEPCICLSQKLEVTLKDVLGETTFLGTSDIDADWFFTGIFSLCRTHNILIQAVYL